MAHPKKEIMVYTQAFTPTEKAIARSNIGAPAPTQVISYGPTGATLVFKPSDSGGGFNKAICNANLTDAGTYLLNYNFVCHANEPSQLYNMIIGLNTGDGTYMFQGSSSNYLALVARTAEYSSERTNSCAGSLILSAPTKAFAENVHFAMRVDASVQSQQTLYIDYFSWNILKFG
jgi:hypothetical protein